MIMFINEQSGAFQVQNVSSLNRGWSHYSVKVR